jgi:hypothetical protein
MAFSCLLTRENRQLPLPLPQPAHQDRGPSVWLLSATSEDAAAFKKSLEMRSGKSPSPFLLIDLATGASPCSPDDILFLKTANQKELDVFVPCGLRETISLSKIIEFLKSAFDKPVLGSQALATVDLGLVRFVGHAKRARRRGWGRSRLEQVLDTLMCREIVGDPSWSQLICSELLEDPDLDDQSLLRAVALRLYADALSKRANWSGGDSNAARAYWRARHAFERAGALRQAISSGRLGDQIFHGLGGHQFELWPRADNKHAIEQPFGFHVRRFSGMRLPLPLRRWADAPPRVGMLRYEYGRALDFDTSSISRWLSGAQASSEMAGLISATPKRGARRFVKFVVDSELAVRAGLAGNARASSRQEIYRFIPRSAFGEFSPTLASTQFGRPAAFEYLARDTRFHRINLLVLTPDRNPISIPFTI